MAERIRARADEGRESKRSKTAVLKFVDHFLSLIHQSSDHTVFVRLCSTKLSRLPTLGTAPKKYNNAGLRQDLKTKKTEETFDPFQNGGLDDDHASSVRPNFPHAQGLKRTYAFYGTLPEPKAEDLKRDHLRKNNVSLCFSHRMKYLTNLRYISLFMPNRTPTQSLSMNPNS